MQRRAAEGSRQNETNMSHDRNIREGIDACRPGSDDLRLPEMADVARAVARDAAVRDLYEQTQRADAAVSKAFHEVSIPEGLAERLLEAIQQPSDAAGVSPRRSRRVWLWSSAAATLTTAAALVVAICLWSPGPQEMGIDDLVNLAQGSFYDAVENGQWDHQMERAPVDHPPCSSVLPTAVAWQRVKTDLDRTTIVYDLTPPGKRRVILMVARSRVAVPGLRSVPPSPPQSTTGGFAIGAWRRGELTYVLIVEGDERRYGRLIKAPSNFVALPPLFRPFA